MTIAAQPLSGGRKRASGSTPDGVNGGAGRSIGVTAAPTHTPHAGSARPASLKTQTRGCGEPATRISTQGLTPRHESVIMSSLE